MVNEGDLGAGLGGGVGLQARHHARVAQRVERVLRVRAAGRHRDDHHRARPVGVQEILSILISTSYLYLFCGLVGGRVRKLRGTLVLACLIVRVLRDTGRCVCGAAAYSAVQNDSSSLANFTALCDPEREPPSAGKL